ncbi:MAG: hypothetical protein CXZ00_16485 [Acidobacteria bacterium]|nr:MAG: hypothetical protein CXZ00_16485 [Acidobacteriota bacterium]
MAWEGDSKEVIHDFPEGVRSELGIDLQLLQWGAEPNSFRPIASVGKGVFELRQQDDASWYRVIYLSRIEDVIHVLHCFVKKTAKTPKKEINLAKARLKLVHQRLQAQKKQQKQEKKKGHGEA